MVPPMLTFGLYLDVCASSEKKNFSQVIPSFIYAVQLHHIFIQYSIKELLPCQSKMSHEYDGGICMRNRELYGSEGY